MSYQFRRASSGIQRNLRFVLSRWWLVVIFAMAAAVCAFAVSVTKEPIYRASTQLYVTSGSDDGTQSAYQGSLASQQRMASYVKLVSSDAVLSRAVAESGSGLSVTQARDVVGAWTSANTVLVTITAESDVPIDASKLANSVASSLMDAVSRLETPSSGGAPLARLNVVTAAAVPVAPVSPEPKKDALLGFLLGALVGVVVCLLWSRVDSRIRSAMDISDVTDILVLGEVPSSEGLRNLSEVDHSFAASPAAESYRRICANLSFVNVDEPVSSVLVTSASELEGKTTTSVCLASQLSEFGNRVILVDGDLRRPSLHSILGLSGSVGLSDYLRGAVDLDTCVQESELGGGFSVISSGTLPPNPTELLGSRRFLDLVSRLRETYDYVLVDAPPVLPAADASIISRAVDGTVFVVRSGKTRKGEFENALHELSISDAKTLGVVLNGVSPLGPALYYGYTTRSQFEFKD